MRNIIIFFLWLFSFNIFSQSPEGINYQAIMRDSTGIILSNQNISLKISITLPPPSSTLEYAETHNITTDNLGLVNLVIGQGTYTGGNLSAFSALDWSQNQYWIMLDMDPNAGTNYTSMGHQQLMSVPYALYAQSSGGTMGTTGAQGQTGPQGLTGAQGNTGIQGPKGVNGTNGTTGVQGQTGPTGTQGPSGAQGPLGQQGITGPTGAQGPTGPPGITGTTGAQGYTGPQGIFGYTGDQGTKGPTGNPGITGAQGTTGDTGSTGTQGIQGATGPLGITGSTGAQGSTGTKGITGALGLTGPTGPESSTDDQTLSVANDSLKIENGNAVSLTELKDHDWYKALTTENATSINNNIYTEGNVGIGIDNPSGLLEIHKTMYGGFNGTHPSLIKIDADFDHMMGGTALVNLIEINLNANDADYGTNTAYAIKSDITSNGGNGQYYGIYSSVSSGDNENAIAGYFQASNSGNGNSYAAQFDGNIKAENLSAASGEDKNILFLNTNNEIVYGQLTSAICAINYFEGFDVASTIPSEWVSSDGGSMARVTGSYSCGVTTEAIYLPKDLNFMSPYFHVSKCNQVTLSYFYREGWNTTGGCMGGSYGGLEPADGDDLFVEYSTDSGTTWITINQHLGADYNSGDPANNNFVEVSEILTINPGTSDIVFRFRASNSNWSDVWLIDNFGLFSSFSSQDLSLSGNTLNLSSDNTPVDLNKYEQDISLSNDILSLSSDPTTVDLSPYKQSLSINGDVVSISDGNSIDLSSLKYWQRDATNEYTYLKNMNDNVGIGTTAPSSLLEVNGGTLKLTNQADSAVLLDLNSERNWHFRQIGSGSSTALELASIGGGGNKNFIINTAGRVGIGTSSPYDKLEVNGGSTSTSIRVSTTTGNAAFRAKTDSADFGWYSRGDVNQFRLYDYNAATDRISIDSSGRVGIGTSSMDSAAILDVNGQIRIRGGNPGPGKVLMSDANGVGKWSNNISSKIEYAGNEVLNAVIHDNEEFWADVHIATDNPDGTLLSFVFDNKNDHLYTAHRKTGSGASETTSIKMFLLDQDGSPAQLLSNSKLLGHVQSLSLEYDSVGEAYLWTSDANGTGLSKIDASNLSSHTSYSNILPAGYSEIIPYVSTNGKYIVARGKKNNTNRVFVYLLSDINNSGNIKPLYEFDLNSDQNNTSTHTFKGILCDNDNIYCLTGDNNTGNKKKLYAYTLNGDLIYKHKITAGQNWAISRGSIWDANGLALYHPHPNIKSLLVGISSGGSNNSNKRIYSIGLGKGMWTLDGSKHPSGIALHLQGTSSDITYEYDEALQFGQYGIPSGSPSTSDPVYTERMRLNSNGNLGIGTVPSNAKLEVNGDAIISGTITSTNFSCSSDRRLKKNIRPINNALEKLLKLRGVKYKWIQNDSIHFDQRYHYGVIAQEIEEQFPALIDNHGNSNKTKHVEYNGFNAIFIEAFKEQQGQIDLLKNKRADQKKNIKTLQEDAELIKERSIEIERKINDALKEIEQK